MKCTDPIAKLVRALPQARTAAVTGRTRAAVASWSEGRRRPSAEAQAKLARAVREYARELLDAADSIDPPALPKRVRQSAATVVYDGDQ